MKMMLGVYFENATPEFFTALGFEGEVVPDRGYVRESYGSGWVIGLSLDVSGVASGISVDLNAMQAQSLFLERYLRDKVGLDSKSLLHLWE